MRSYRSLSCLFALIVATGAVTACGSAGDPTSEPGSGAPYGGAPGGPSDGSFGACSPRFSSGHSTVVAGCTSCVNEDNKAQNSVDGVRSTYAQFAAVSAVSGGVASAPANGTGTFTATAQPGLTYPAGEMVGGIVRLPGGTGVTASVTFSTLLSGSTQEAFGADNGDGTGTSDQTFLHPTAKAFDAVKAAISVNIPDGSRKEVLLYEFCN